MPIAPNLVFGYIRLLTALNVLYISCNCFKYVCSVQINWLTLKHLAIIFIIIIISINIDNTLSIVFNFSI